MESNGGVTKEGEQWCLSKCCSGALAECQRPVRILQVEATGDILDTVAMHLAQVLQLILKHTHAFCSNERIRACSPSRVVSSIKNCASLLPQWNLTSGLTCH